MATMFEQIFGNAKSPGGLLGNPAFMVGSGLLSNQGNPWGGAIQGLAAAQGYKLSEAKMKKEEEQEARLKELQDMQMAAAKQAQERQQYTQALLTAGSSQNPALLQDPAFQSQLRMKAAAYGDPAALQAGGLLQALQDPLKPTATMQNIAQIARPGTPEYEALMREAIIKPKNSVTINNGLLKPPTGYTWLDETNPAAGVKPLTGGPADPAASKEGREAASNIARVDQSLANYRDAVTRIGTQVLPTSEKIVLSGAHTDLLMEMKELYNLGVLNGPDYTLMLGVIKDPTSAWTVGQGYTGKDLLNQLDKVVVPKLEAAKKLYREKYGRAYSDGGGTPTVKDVRDMSDAELEAFIANGGK